MAGALLAYVESTQQGSVRHLRRFVTAERDDTLVLDRATLRNLEVERGADGSVRASLLAVLDHSTTRMGSRALRDWLVRPSANLELIADRHRSVAELVDDPGLLDELREALADLPDLERLAGRVGLGAPLPRELASLRDGIDALPAVRAAVDRATSPLLRRLVDDLDPLADLGGILHQRLAGEPAAVVGAGVLRGGWDTALDEHRRIARGGKELVARVEGEERARTGIGSLKVRYNKVFGYYIEVSKANAARMPEGYERRQTLTNAERFVTPELKELEARILSAEELAAARERELYDALAAELAEHARRIATSAERVASLDVLGGVRRSGTPRRTYCRPSVEDSWRARDPRGPPPGDRGAPARAAVRRQRLPSSTRRVVRSCSSPDRTWAASRPTCGRSP